MILDICFDYLMVITFKLVFIIRTELSFKTSLETHYSGHSGQRGPHRKMITSSVRLFELSAPTFIHFKQCSLRSCQKTITGTESTTIIHNTNYSFNILSSLINNSV